MKVEVDFNNIKILVEADPNAEKYDLNFDNKYFLEVDRNFKPTGKATDWAELPVNVDYYKYSFRVIKE